MPYLLLCLEGNRGLFKVFVIEKKGQPLLITPPHTLIKAQFNMIYWIDKKMNKMHNTRYLPSNVCFLILNLRSSFYIFVWTEEVVNVIVQFARFEPQNSFSLTQAWMEHGVIFSIGNQLFRYGFRLFEKIENCGNCQQFSYIDRKNALYFQYWKN